MQFRPLFGLVCLVALVLFGAVAATVFAVAAQGPARQTSLLIPYTEFEWWLLDWQTNQVYCRLFIEHEGLPTISEVANSCSAELANAWFYTPMCKTAFGCKGVYAFLFASQAKQKQVILELPPPTIWVSLEGCDPHPPENLCQRIPILVLTGEEPIHEHEIVSIEGTYDGLPFRCNGSICKLPLQPTPLLGVHIEFWAQSSFGDASEVFFAEVRVIDTGVNPTPGASGWYVDVISSQWTGEPLASCARIWEAFPPIGPVPGWLSTPENFQLLASDNPYYYLAGRMIAQGLVDAAACPGGGLLPNGYADTCGLETARPLVEAWQNQFDHRIVETSTETGIPAQLLKNLFAQESQFWPGVFRVPYEFGLGQITDNGADSMLLWNPGFYAQFCPLVLSQGACDLGYLKLGDKERAILRGALALQAHSDCADCPTGIDLTNVNFSISLFANALQSNCAQVSRTIYNATNSMAGRVASYEDLWRFTIANYHAGSGCTAYAIHLAWVNRSSNQITWEEVAQYFTEPCKSAVPYVEKITK